MTGKRRRRFSIFSVGARTFGRQTGPQPRNFEKLLPKFSASLRNLSNFSQFLDRWPKFRSNSIFFQIISKFLFFIHFTQKIKKELKGTGGKICGISDIYLSNVTLV